MKNMKDSVPHFKKSKLTYNKLKMGCKKLSFFTAHFWGIGKKDAERTKRAKTRLQTCFCLPEGVQRYVEWRDLFVA